MAYGDALQHLVDLLYLAVDFCGANAHAAGIEHRVRAAVNDHAAFRRLFGIVALGPDTRELAEIGGMEALGLRVVPEAQGQRREMPGADQLAFFANQGMTIIVPDFHGHAQALALDLPAPHRQHRVADDKAGTDVGTARHRGQAQVGLELAVHVVIAFRRQRRAGRQQQLE
ncbi:hypothetical protein D3C80_989420 [compost metagenome]